MFINKDLFDLSYDLLVQIPDLLANVESVKKGQLNPAKMQANVAAFVTQLRRWGQEALFPRAAFYAPTVTEWSIEKVVANIDDGTIASFTFARGLCHYLAAVIIMSQFGQRCIDALPVTPDRAVHSILLIVEKQALRDEQGCLWPWLVPLRIAHFSGIAASMPQIIALCVQLERRYSWPILQSERYEIYSEQQ